MSGWPKIFIKHPCSICGKLISNCGFAYRNHENMHKRKGETKKNYEAVKKGGGV